MEDISARAVSTGLEKTGVFVGEIEGDIPVVTGAAVSNGISSKMRTEVIRRPGTRGFIGGEWFVGSFVVVLGFGFLSEEGYVGIIWWYCFVLGF
ncbi:unnamed protein product [Ilex paraguariensis]|uniref:Uncharacterized protein n=1 Tax=Ilex paraguariensis TaxID=185542 RepID=A0ABC8S6A5_9AQUA